MMFFRVRFTVRRIMVAVAFCGLALAFYVWLVQPPVGPSSITPRFSNLLKASFAICGGQ